MKTLKALLSLLSLASFLIISLPSYAGNSYQKTKTLTKPVKTSNSRHTQPVRTKEYTIPGATAIGIAKQHGYLFPSRTSKKRVYIRNGKRRVYRRKGTCKFMGMHWQVDAGKECPIIGFLAPKSKPKCRKLRKGWKVKGIKLQGNYVWSSRPANTSVPFFSATSKNQSSKTKALTIKTVTLIGPEGPFNKFEEAFNHCSDRNYQ